MRAIFVVSAVCLVGLVCGTAGAQKESTASTTPESLHHAWIVPVAEVAASAAADPEIREWMLAQHSRSLLQEAAS